VRTLKLLVIVILLAAAVVVMSRSPRGVEFQKQYAINRECCDFSMMQAATLSALDDGRPVAPPA